MNQVYKKNCSELMIRTIPKNTHISFIILSIFIGINIFFNYNLLISNKFDVSELHKESFYLYDKIMYILIYIAFNFFIYYTPIQCGNKISQFNIYVYSLFFSILLNIMFYTFFIVDEEDNERSFQIKKMKIILYGKIIIYFLLFFLCLISYIFYQQNILQKNPCLAVDESSFINKTKVYIKNHFTTLFFWILSNLAFIYFSKLVNWLDS